MALHKNLLVSEIHIIFAFTYADETARLAATGFTSADVGKIAQQQSNSTYWLLTAYSPITWAPLAGGLVNPMTTRGDVVFGGTGGSPQRLGALEGGYFRSGGSSADPTFTRTPDFASVVASATVGASVDASAIIQADSVTKGFLMPRMTAAQRDAIVDPATGLMVYVPLDKRVWFFDGSVWRKVVVATQKVVMVAADGTGDFAGIQDAIDSILDASDINRYVVSVAPGVYNEDVVMADYIQVSGEGWDSYIQGQIVCTGLEYAQLDNIRVESENKPAVVCGVTGEVNLTGVFLFATWDATADPGTVRCVVECTAGILYLYKESEAYLTVTDAVNTSPNTIEAVYHLEGTDEVYLECYGTFEYVDTVNGGNTLCCLYSTNTSEDTQTVNQLGTMEFIGQGTHSNPIRLIKHSAAAGKTGFSYKLIAGDVGTGGTPSFVLCEVTSSQTSGSTARTAFCRSRVAGVADANSYLGAATTANDAVLALDHLVLTSTDVIPGRDTTGGSSGDFVYSVTNTFGTSASSGLYNGVEKLADVTDWGNVSTALGGQAGANANYVFQSDGAGGGSMVPNVAAITRRLKVGLGGGVQYTSIKTAVEAAVAGGASATSPWRIDVYPGTYTEAAFSIQPGIVLMSTSGRADSVFVVANDPTNDLITSTGGYVMGINFSGVTTADKACIRCATNLSLTVLHGISFRNCNHGLVVSGGAKVIATSFSVNLTGASQSVGTGVLVTGSGSYFAITGGFFSCPSALLPAYASNPIQTGIKVQDSARVFLTSCTFQIAYKTTDANAMFADGGAEVGLFSSEVSGCANGAHIGSSGTGTSFVIQGASFAGNDKNGWCESSTGKFFVLASADDFNWTSVAGSVLSGVVQLRDAAKTYIVGSAAYWFPSGAELDLEKFFHDQTSTGLSYGGAVTAGTGLEVDVASGAGWITDHTHHDSESISWDADSLTLTASSTNYVVYDSATSALDVLLSDPGDSAILLATVMTSGSGIRYLHQTRNVVHDQQHLLHDYLLNTRKVALKSGLGVIEGSSARKFDVGSGAYYIALDTVSYAGASDAAFSYFYGTNGATEVASQTELSITQYDNAGTLTSMTSGYFRSDTVILTSDGRVNVIYGTAEYATQALAEAAALGNTPTFMELSAFPLAQIIVEEDAGIVAVLDRRPQPGSSSGGGGAGGVSVHSALAGLSADDHTQYLLVSGTRAMTGNFAMGANNITGVGTVDGVTVSGHASRHNPGGSDALALGVPVAVLAGNSPAEGSEAAFARRDHQHGASVGTAVSVGTSNSAGSGTNFARDNHVHDHGSQSTATHHAVATTGANGFLASTDKSKLDGIAAGADVTGSNAPQAHATSHHSGGSDALAHQSIAGSGSNAHSTIDTHLGSTSNPHSVTKTQVSLGNVTDDAQLKRAAADINSFTEKATPVSADVLLIEDSAASYAKKKVQVGNLPGGGTAPVFGTEFAQASKSGSESVTGTTWTQYQRYTTASFPAGTYRIGYRYQWAQSSTSNNFESRVQVDDITTLISHVQEPQDPASTQTNVVAGFGYVTFATTATHNIDIDYRAGSAATTAYVLASGFEIWRVS